MHIHSSTHGNLDELSTVFIYELGVFRLYLYVIFFPQGTPTSYIMQMAVRIVFSFSDTALGRVFALGEEMIMCRRYWLYILFQRLISTPFRIPSFSVSYFPTILLFLSTIVASHRPMIQFRSALVHAVTTLCGGSISPDIFAVFQTHNFLHIYIRTMVYYYTEYKYNSFNGL